MRSIFLTCMVALVTLAAFHPHFFNSMSIHGKVTNTTGVPLSGVTVREKSAGNRTVTNPQGDFTITVKNEKAILVFRAAGYQVLELPAQAKQTMKVVLQAIEGKPEETVITGYHKDIELQQPRMMEVQKMAAQTILQSKAAPLGSAARRAVTSRRPYAGVSRRYDSSRDKSGFDEFNTEDYDAIVENRFLRVRDNALSTFSIDVDAAAYSNIRRYLQMGQLPPAGAVRIEEMVNYFHYAYPQPVGDVPFTVNTEMSACPWNSNHRLVLIGLQGKRIPVNNFPPSNIVFLIDVSGSMKDENKLPLVKASLKLLTDQLREQDNVSIVVYAGQAGLVLPATSGAAKMKIKDAIDRLEAGGSTAGGEGIRLAYATAAANFVEKGNNRVILCTDGDFNVGVSSDAELEKIIEEKRKRGVFLTVLGYGMGNYKDNKMQKLADKGNGNHAYIDGLNEANKVLVQEFGGTLFTIAKDVKLQVEFNPAAVQAYRLIGYENRLLNKEDFNNDRKDAGELGSGHTVTALYEVIPAGVKNEFPDSVDRLKYQAPQQPVAANAGNREIMTIKLRYKEPDGNTSKLITHPVADNHMAIAHTSDNFRFAAAVAQSGMLLRESEFSQSASFSNALELATGALGKDEEGYRKEFCTLLQKAQRIVQQQKHPGDRPQPVGYAK